jgi:hypothetical protein
LNAYPFFLAMSTKLSVILPIFLSLFPFSIMNQSKIILVIPSQWPHELTFAFVFNSPDTTKFFRSKSADEGKLLFPFTSET